MEKDIILVGVVIMFRFLCWIFESIVSGVLFLKQITFVLFPSSPTLPPASCCFWWAYPLIPLLSSSSSPLHLLLMPMRWVFDLHPLPIPIIDEINDSPHSSLYPPYNWYYNWNNPYVHPSPIPLIFFSLHRPLLVRSIPHGGPIELFLIPASAPPTGVMKAVVCAILCLGWCI